MRVLDRPGVVKDPGMCGRSLCGNREVSSVAVAGSDGPHREGEEPKPMMDAGEKSNSAIVARKPTNKAGRPAAEPVERRAETEGMRASNAHAGRSTGQACPRRWIAYGKPQGTDGRNGSPRSSTILALRCCGRRSSRSGGGCPGVDGLTWPAYAADLDHRIEDLHARVRRGRTGRCHHDDGTSRKRMATSARSRWPLSRTRSSRGRRPPC